jgi:Na+-driven multidrug efflux pump
LIQTIVASVIHLFLANYLAVTLDMKMLGISIATTIHLFLRFVVAYIVMKSDKDLNRYFVPISDPESYEKTGLLEMNS